MLLVMSADEQLIRPDETPPAATIQGFSPAQRRSLTEVVIEQFAHYLDSGDIKPGQAIPSERELMRALAVGRSTVREALRALVALDILESCPGKGYFVKRLPGSVQQNLAQFVATESLFIDLMEARMYLELSIAELAAQRAEPSDIAYLEDAYHEVQLAVASNGPTIEHTVKLHYGLAKATHNAVFALLMETIMPIIVDKMRSLPLSSAETLQLGEQMIEGLRNGDPEQMRSIMAHHLSRSRALYMEAIARGWPGQGGSCASARTSGSEQERRRGPV
ncbi:MAG: FCD domain-containing protein [Candidatus Bipolaricaulis sp.]|nr:FCD domain-containing protein [Candidatus Bipolaricaulis sp.]